MANPNPNQSGLRPWKPGQSGNPKGGKRKTQEEKDAAQELRDLCKKYRAEPVKRYLALVHEYEQDTSPNKSASKAKGLTLKVYTDLLGFLHEYFNGKARQALDHSLESGTGSVIVKVLGTDELDKSGSD